jgi:hypothetical protein
VHDEDLPFRGSGDTGDRVPNDLKCLVLRVEKVEFLVSIQHAGDSIHKRRCRDDTPLFEQEKYVMTGAMTDVVLDEP